MINKSWWLIKYFKIVFKSFRQWRLTGRARREGIEFLFMSRHWTPHSPVPRGSILSRHDLTLHFYKLTEPFNDCNLLEVWKHCKLCHPTYIVTTSCTGCPKKKWGFVLRVVLRGSGASNRKMSESRPPFKFNFVYWEAF